MTASPYAENVEKVKTAIESYIDEVIAEQIGDISTLINGTGSNDSSE